MKKSVVCGEHMMALAIATPVASQSVSMPDQIGNANAATVMQTGSDTSDIDPVGNGNTAGVTQSGSHNESITSQTGSSVTVTQGF